MSSRFRAQRLVVFIDPEELWFRPKLEASHNGVLQVALPGLARRTAKVSDEAIAQFLGQHATQEEQ